MVMFVKGINFFVLNMCGKVGKSIIIMIKEFSLKVIESVIMDYNINFL